MKNLPFSKIAGFYLTLFSALCFFPDSGVSSVSEYEDIEVLRSDEEGVVFRYLVPEPTQSKIELSGQLFDLININRCALSNLPGKPQLPVRRVVIAVPPQAEISVEVLDKEVVELSGINLAAAVKVKLDEDNPVGYRAVPSRILEKQDQYYPSEPVFFNSPTFLRSQRIIELEIFPVQYNPAQKSVIYYSRITVKVSFSGDRRETVPGVKDRFEKIYQNVLLNYDQSQRWRITAERMRLLKPGVVYPFGYSDNWYKVTVRENGIYRIDQSMLTGAGVPINILDPKTLRMFSGGGKALPLDNSNPFLELKEMAIFVSGEEDGTFDSEDFILFFGWSTNDWDSDSTGEVVGFHTNPYTNDNVIWLTFNPQVTYDESPKRMQTKDGSLVEQYPIQPQKFKSRIHEEQDNALRYYSSGYVADYFNWYWMETLSKQMSLSLPGALAGDTCLIKVKHTDSNPTIRINGEEAEILHSISSATLTVARSFDFKGGLVDTLEISFPADTYLDWYEIEYFRQFECHDRQLFFESPKISGVAQFDISNLYSSQIYLYEITDYFNVKRFDGVLIEGEFARFQDSISAEAKNSYFLVDESRIKKPNLFFQDEPSDLKETSHRSDFIIITHSDFYEQIQRLKSFRESFNQIIVKVVKLDDVYDEFSGGLSDPVAIRDFLKFAYRNWEKPAPAFCLLAGDGHYDYKNNLGTGAKNLIPPFAPTWEGDKSVSDENYVYFGRYGYLDSDSTYVALDRGLDMVISRWPVRTEDEVELVLDKVTAYEESPQFGTWRNLITLVADDEYTSESNSEAFHTKDTEELAKLHVPPSFNLSKIYLMEYPFDYKEEKPEAEEAIINAFNSGTLIINYMGHGNPDVWAHERVFKRSQDIPRLTNRRKLPLIYTASCSIGLFFSPFGEGMGEELLRTKEKGSIATISATWLVYPDPNAALNYKVYDLLLNQDSLSVGEALFIAKFLRQPNSNDRQFVLFGDPVMKLGAPRLKAVLTEVNPDTLSALSLVSLKGEIQDEGGNLLTDFEGIARILAFDSKRERTHTMPGGGTVDYVLPGPVMFRGDAEVGDGKFQASFMVPKDISYGGTTGRIIAYLMSQNQDGVGVRDSLVIRGSDTTVIDTIGPQIALNFDNEESFTSGEIIQPHSILKITIFDEHGINLTGEVGHGITLVIDQDYQDQVDLTESFEYDVGSYQQGSLEYQLPNLSEGDHLLDIKAWDNANNSAMISVEVKVGSPVDLELTQVMNYPNPFPEVTNFYYLLSQDVDRVEIKIFTQAGRLIKHIPWASAQAGINFSSTWDGRDEEGDKVANGIYIYKIIAESTVNGERKKKEAYGKAVVVR